MICANNTGPILLRGIGSEGSSQFSFPANHRILYMINAPAANRLLSYSGIFLYANKKKEINKNK